MKSLFKKLTSGQGRVSQEENEYSEKMNLVDKTKECYTSYLDNHNHHCFNGNSVVNNEVFSQVNLPVTNRTQKPNLSLDLKPIGDPSNGEGTAMSPDSEGDVLAVLDRTPDALDDLPHSGHRSVSFAHIFEPLYFAELMPNVYIPNQPITLRIIDMDVLPSTLNFFNQCVFTISLQHGSTSWIISRKSRQIHQLHNQLKLFKAMLKLPAATTETRERRQSYRFQIKSNAAAASRNSDDVNYKRLVKFPQKALQRMDRFTAGEVELYLGNLLRHSLLKTHHAVLEFFEISPISFISNLGPKMEEGFLRKKSGGRRVLICCGGHYKRRWLVIRETCVFVISPRDGNIRSVMLYDSGFQVSHGFRHTRINKGLLITNLSRSLILKCDGDKSEAEWRSSIEKAKTEFASDFVKENRYLSFVPPRKESYARWYVDASWYMSDVADLLEAAKEEIFITDWWLSPDIYLKRPDLTGSKWKLNEILKRQASRGVKVFVMLYKEVELALGLNSLYSKQNLCTMHQNIKVFRHPDHHKGSLYWAHHEKMVVVDQMYAFVGGIDLCYGRWDDHRHKLVDVGHAGLKTKPPETVISRLLLNPGVIFPQAERESTDKPSDVTPPENVQCNGDNNTSENLSVKLNGTIGGTETLPDEVDQNLSNNQGVINHKNGSLPNGRENVPHTKTLAEELSLKKASETSESESSSPDAFETDEISSDAVENSIKTNKHTLYAKNDKAGDSILKIYSSNDVLNPKRSVSKSTDEFSTDHSTTDRDFSSLDPDVNKVDEDSDRQTANPTILISCEDDKGNKKTFGDHDGGSTSSSETSYSSGAKEWTSEEEAADGACARANVARNDNRKDSRPLHTKVAKNLRSVKNLGIDLVGEMREKKKKMQESLPRLRRTRSSNSEFGYSSDSEDDAEAFGEAKGRSLRLHQRIRRQLKPKQFPHNKKLSRNFTGSLIDLHKALTHEEANSVHLWVGKDYVNWITKDLYDPHMPFNDSVDRHQTPRMPWHDIALYVEGPAARDAARHFIQRWNAIKEEKMKNNERYPFLIPKSYRLSSFVPSVLSLRHRVKCQVLRSLGSWSGGVNQTERSIYNAYIDVIKKAKHFIYIENQFFISSSSLTGSEVTNSIAYHLYERIYRAHNCGEVFRVYVVLPLLPAFEGQIGTPSGVAMQYILHYTYQSIIRGPHSLIGLLSQSGIPWEDYLSFSSLRNHDVLEGKPVTELIYIHSKLMIVDDRIVICGSANINDRSLLGSRDSEMDLIIEDEEFIRGTMNGRPYKRGKFAGSLRLFLFEEHLGLDTDINDPVSEKFFQTWQEVAMKNTKVYREVFNCVPCDEATTFAELQKIRGENSVAKMFPEKAKEALKALQGRLVCYPLQFLKEEYLKPGPTTKEFLLPIDMWI